MSALLKAILDWLTSLIRTEAAKPRTLDDAKTPGPIRDRWNAALRERLRDKNGGH